MTGRIAAVALVTLREGLRARMWTVWILYAAVLAGLPALLGGTPPEALGPALSAAAYQALAALALLTAVLAGVRILPRAIEGRLLLALLSKPLRRGEYAAGVAGGIAALCGVLVGGMAILGGAVLASVPASRTARWSAPAGTIEVVPRAQDAAEFVCRAPDTGRPLFLTVPISTLSWEGTPLSVGPADDPTSWTELRVPRHARTWDFPLEGLPWQNGTLRLTVQVRGGAFPDAFGPAPRPALLARDRTVTGSWCAAAAAVWGLSTFLGTCAFALTTAVSWRLATLATLTFGLAAANPQLLREMPRLLTTENIRQAFGMPFRPHVHDHVGHEHGPECDHGTGHGGADAKDPSPLDAALGAAGRALATLATALPDVGQARVGPSLGGGHAVPPGRVGALLTTLGAYGAAAVAAAAIAFRYRQLV